MKKGFLGVVVMTLGLSALAFALAGNGSAAAPADEANDAAVKPSTLRTLTLPDTPYNYANPNLPSHFKTQAARRLDNTPANNRITDAGATLGRVLFYDTRLSANNKVACASCHEQKRGFAPGERFATGFEGKHVDRRAMPLMEVGFYPRGRFFWDERAPTLEAQVLMPIQDKLEMGQNLNKLREILAKDSRYPELFNKAFGSTEVTNDRVSRALAQFVRSMISYRSKYDIGRGSAETVRDNFTNFTAQENQGKTVFLNRCATCHLRGQDAHFTVNRTMNNGLDANSKDGGVGDITLRGNHMGLFKSPSLRNVELSAPYMHDGRLATLEAVVDHYSQNVQQNPNRDNRVRRFNFNNNQKAALVAFMKTLTDREFIVDPKFSDPFQ